MKATGRQPACWDACGETAYRIIRALLLDVDGTLVDDKLLHVLAWSRAFRRLGREIDATTLLHAIGMGGDKLAPAIRGEDSDLIQRAQERHREACVDGGRIGRSLALPGAADLLAALRRRGVRTALASSARKGSGGEGPIGVRRPAAPTEPARQYSAPI